MSVNVAAVRALLIFLQEGSISEIIILLWDNLLDNNTVCGLLSTSSQWGGLLNSAEKTRLDKIFKENGGVAQRKMSVYSEGVSG